MKILKRGELPQDKVYTWECSKCYSIMEATRGEALRTDMSPKNECYIIFKCPVCGNEEYVDD